MLMSRIKFFRGIWTAQMEASKKLLISPLLLLLVLDVSASFGKFLTSSMSNEREGNYVYVYIKGY